MRPLCWGVGRNPPVWQPCEAWVSGSLSHGCYRRTHVESRRTARPHLRRRPPSLGPFIRGREAPRGRASQGSVSGASSTTPTPGASQLQSFWMKPFQYIGAATIRTAISTRIRPRVTSAASGPDRPMGRRRNATRRGHANPHVRREHQPIERQEQPVDDFGREEVRHAEAPT